MKAVFPYSLRIFVIFSEKDEVKIQIVKHSFKDRNWYYLHSQVPKPHQTYFALQND
jgi:hypothetical protein